MKHLQYYIQIATGMARIKQAGLEAIKALTEKPVNEGYFKNSK